MPIVRTSVVLLIPVVLLGCQGSPVGGTDDAPQRPGVGEPPQAGTPPAPALNTANPSERPAAPAGQEPGNVTKRGAPLTVSEIARLCASVCDSTRALSCGNLPECQGECENSFAMPACRLELGAMLVCTARTPTSGFVCGAHGPALREGTCEKEQAAAANCLAEYMQRATERANAAPQ